MDGTFQPYGESYDSKSNSFTSKALVDVNSTEASDLQFALADYVPLTLVYVNK
jgi:hypothetical protein